MERWLPGEGAVVASFYAPILFPPAPVLVFSLPGEGAGSHLVATGSVLDLNPNRIVLKRIVLSGATLKINVRSAVVRHMFFNRGCTLLQLIVARGRDCVQTTSCGSSPSSCGPSTGGGGTSKRLWVTSARVNRRVPESWWLQGRMGT